MLIYLILIFHVIEFKEDKIFGYDSSLGYSQFYYYTSYYFHIIPKDHNTQKWLVILHLICRHIFSVISIYFYQENRHAVKKTFISSFPPLNSATEASHFKSRSRAAAAAFINCISNVSDHVGTGSMSVNFPGSVLLYICKSLNVAFLLHQAPHFWEALRCGDHKSKTWALGKYAEAQNCCTGSESWTWQILAIQ